MVSPVNRLKVDFVEQEVLRLIETGELRPGASLQQRDLASRLEVSPTPVREAFRRLEMAGILVANSHSGFRVADPFDPSDEASTVVRRALEHVGMELAAKAATESDVAELRALNASYATSPVDEARDWHWRLHLRIVELARSPLLSTHLRLLWSLLDTGKVARRSRSESADHHSQIIDAIASRDVAAAQRLMDEHHSQRAVYD